MVSDKEAILTSTTDVSLRIFTRDFGTYGIYIKCACTAI